MLIARLSLLLIPRACEISRCVLFVCLFFNPFAALWGHGRFDLFHADVLIFLSPFRLLQGGKFSINCPKSIGIIGVSHYFKIDLKGLSKYGRKKSIVFVQFLL
jgi:hypothetical protein